MMGMYGTTVGAGTLFLPVEVGTRGPLVFLTMLLLGLPLSLIPHVLICRIFMRDNQVDNATLPLFGKFFGPKGRQGIKLFFCIAHFPVTLVYLVSLVNALDNYLTAHLHFAALNRALLAVITVGLLFILLSKGRDRVVTTMSSLAIPFALCLLVIALMQIPAWHPANLTNAIRETTNVPASHSLKALWLALPLITFSFCSAPMLSPLSSWYLEEGKGGEAKAVRVIRLAYGAIFFSIIFFVLSCMMSMPRELFISAKAQNLNVLSVMAGNGFGSLLFIVAPFIAMVAMTKSFLGVCLPVAEIFSSLVGDAAGLKGEAGQKRAKTIAFTLLFAMSLAITYDNPDVISLIETVCGPLIAIYLFGIPAWLVYTRKELHSLRGVMSLIVIAGGLLTVSALIYGIV
ncbi:amino acid permease [Pantoea sp. KPR_PJ]|uniref:amino acid permease n=1 Tax=Pantoea sp. KPR_PJ TaxID=2738375 RepID=UPI0035274A2E